MMRGTTCLRTSSIHADWIYVSPYPPPLCRPPRLLAHLLRHVHAGTIAMRVGNPHDTDQWEWSCGFCPGSRPGEIQAGTSATLDDAGPLP
jgi:hypothetical protein